ncbi:MAG: DUF4411 family protein [Methanobrevibacter sp.]|jgi:hypothetical protein|nr:DUF4411 family protein [Methanobrevibacter sp.]
MNHKYIVDTNILIRRAEHEIYDEKSFPSHWLNFDKLVDKGTIISTPSVYDEIKDDIVNWCNNHKKMFIPPNDNKYREELNFIKNELKDWYFSKDESDLWADRDLVIYAKAYNLVLVTQEGLNLNANQKKYKIPSACVHLGAYCRNGKECTSEINPDTAPFQCIDFTELVKREKLYLNDKD